MHVLPSVLCLSVLFHNVHADAVVTKHIEVLDKKIHFKSTDDEEFPTTGTTTGIFEGPSNSSRFVLWFHNFTVDSTGLPSFCDNSGPSATVSVYFTEGTTDLLSKMFCSAKVKSELPINIPIPSGHSHTFSVKVTADVASSYLVSFAYQIDDSCEVKGCAVGSTCQLWKPGIARCLCSADKKGDLCDVPITCSDNPCKYGSCVKASYNGAESYACNCRPGYTGKRCETPFQVHKNNLCKDDNVCGGDKSRGKCNTNKSIDTLCTCETGYSGVYCELDVCDQVNLCAPGSVCLVDTKDPLHYKCVCPPMSQGTFCSQPITFNSDKECQKVCVSGHCKAKECRCFTGSFGSLCNTRLTAVYQPKGEYDVCAHVVCDNKAKCLPEKLPKYRCRLPQTSKTLQSDCYFHPCGEGTCQESDDDFTCSCPPHYTGTNCQTPIANGSFPMATSNYLQACARVDCGLYGTCQLGVNGTVSCQCDSGYAGVNCHFLSNGACNKRPPCKNGGTCYDKPTAFNKFRCECTDGWTGTTCNKRISLCVSAPCKNGATCDDTGTSYKCKCPPGYAGSHCETEQLTTAKDFCTSSPCRNGATCSNGADTFTCFCKKGWKGSKCESREYLCLIRQRCLHGTCKDVLVEVDPRLYVCECDYGWEGPNCQHQIDYCSTSQPCQNNGTCSLKKEGGYTCQCDVGFKGENCSEVIDYCQNARCLNTQTLSCQNTRYKAICNCLPGYSGEFCQTNIDDCAPQPCEHGVCKDLVNSYQCVCSFGYGGRNCTEDTDECQSNPCLHNGKCKDLIGRFECDCPYGYEGERCENNVDFCRQSPCAHGGTCMNIAGGYLCQCSRGWTGKSCNIDINECASKPCLHGGACIDMQAKFECRCLFGYKGHLCEDIINACDSNPCVVSQTINCNNTKPGLYQCNCKQGFVGTSCETNINECVKDACNGRGACTDGINSFTCACDDGWTGSTCQLSIDDCVTQPDGQPACLNGAICKDSHKSYMCSCLPGYNGTRCEHKIDYCLSSPCVRGTCESLVTGFRCDCPPGFTGRTCNEDINECVGHPCQNGGTCSNIDGSFACSCKLGYVGSLCETNIGVCAAMSSNACGNGTCEDTAGGFNCKCFPDYTGKFCNQKIDWCASNLCQKNSTKKCVSILGGYTCQCLPGYSGAHCTKDINECASKPCRHGGSCTDLINDYRCLCLPGYTDKDCGTDIDDCSPNPCAHNSTCHDKVNHYACQCKAGYRGVNCTIDIDECAGNPCNNHGSCTDLENDYHCICNSGYEGKDCSINIDDCHSSPCQNGGTCVDGVDTYSCACGEFFEGTHCEKKSGACVYENAKKEVGDIWEVDCNRCRCNSTGGYYICTDMWCGWEDCLPSNSSTAAGHQCDTCSSPLCVTSNCTESYLCYDKQPEDYNCLEERCLNLTLNVNTKRLDADENDEKLCKRLRKRVMLDSNRLFDESVRMECKWESKESALHLNIKVENDPDLAESIKDILLGFISNSPDGWLESVSTNEPSGIPQTSKKLNLLDIIIPAVAAVVVATGLVIFTVLIIKSKRKKEAPRDQWVTMSRQPKTGKNEDAAQFVNPIYRFGGQPDLSPAEDLSWDATDRLSYASGTYAVVESVPRNSPMSDAVEADEDGRSNAWNLQTSASDTPIPAQRHQQHAADNNDTYSVPANNTLVPGATLDWTPSSSLPLSGSRDAYEVPVNHYDTPRSLMQFRSYPSQDESTLTSDSAGNSMFPPPPTND